MEFESRIGTYALVLRVDHYQTIPVGALGKLEFQPGFYIYMGSAFGPGGLRARLAHHVSARSRPHWHIDYLRRQVDPVAIWYTFDPVRREHQWAKEFAAMPDVIVPFPGFGASDCQCNAHLFYITNEPSLDDFYERLLIRHIEHEVIFHSYPNDSFQ
jgi:Uri superfamily endonuclease